MAMNAGGESFSDWLEAFNKEVNIETALAGWPRPKQDAPAAEPPQPDSFRIASLAQEGVVLREQLEQSRARSSAERQASEVQLAKLETSVRALQEQVHSLKENRSFLEEAFGRSEAAKAAVEAELKLERERGQLAAAELVALKNTAAEREGLLAKLREDLAARDDMLGELRRQASVYQERLVQAKELTDADVALLRQELKLFLEEFRIMMNTVRKARGDSK